MAEWPYKAAVDCRGDRLTHQTPFDRKRPPREGVVREKGRWNSNLGLNIFTIAVTDMMMLPHFTDLPQVYRDTLTNISKLNAPLLSPGEG